MLIDLHKSKYFGSLDLLRGYHHISMREEDRPKTAFLTQMGFIVLKRMPFGLCNATAPFQRLIDVLLKHQIGNEILVYLDYLLMFSETQQEL